MRARRDAARGGVRLRRDRRRRTVGRLGQPDAALAAAGAGRRHRPVPAAAGRGGAARACRSTSSAPGTRCSPRWWSDIQRAAARLSDRRQPPRLLRRRRGASGSPTRSRRSGADLLFLGMTSPKKEIFVATYGERTGAKVVHGVGGSFDVLAGVVRRAPASWQRLGLRVALSGRAGAAPSGQALPDHERRRSWRWSPANRFRPPRQVPTTREQLRSPHVRVVIAGQGYVGLPLAVRAAECGHDVVGFDVDAIPRRPARRRQLLCGGHLRRKRLRGALASRVGTVPTTDAGGLRGLRHRAHHRADPAARRRARICPTSRPRPRCWRSYLRPRRDGGARVDDLPRHHRGGRRPDPREGLRPASPGSTSTSASAPSASTRATRPGTSSTPRRSSPASTRSRCKMVKAFYDSDRRARP